MTKRRRRGRPSLIRAGRARGRLGDERDRLPLHRGGGGGGGGGGGSSRVFPPGFRARAVFIFCRRLRRLPGSPRRRARARDSAPELPGGRRRRGAPRPRARERGDARGGGARDGVVVLQGRCLEEFRNRAPRGLRPGCPVAARRRSFRSNLRRRLGIRRYLVSALGDQSLLLRAPPDARGDEEQLPRRLQRAHASRAGDTFGIHIGIRIGVRIGVLLALAHAPPGLRQARPHVLPEPTGPGALPLARLRGARPRGEVRGGHVPMRRCPVRATGVRAEQARRDAHAVRRAETRVGSRTRARV